MKFILSTVFVIALCVVGVGFYRGWFTVTVHQDKIQQDEKKVEERVHSK